VAVEKGWDMNDGGVEIDNDCSVGSLMTLGHDGILQRQSTEESDDDRTQPREVCFLHVGI
jgi:hypothetical protein